MCVLNSAAAICAYVVLAAEAHSAATLVGPYWLARSVIALALKFNELEPRASVRVLAVAGAEAHQTMPAAAPAMIRFDEVLTAPELAQFEQARGHQPLRVRVALGHHISPGYLVVTGIVNVSMGMLGGYTEFRRELRKEASDQSPGG